MWQIYKAIFFSSYSLLCSGTNLSWQAVWPSLRSSVDECTVFLYFQKHNYRKNVLLEIIFGIPKVSCIMRSELAKMVVWCIFSATVKKWTLQKYPWFLNSMLTLIIFRCLSHTYLYILQQLHQNWKGSKVNPTASDMIWRIIFIYNEIRNKISELLKSLFQRNWLGNVKSENRKINKWLQLVSYRFSQGLLNCKNKLCLYTAIQHTFPCSFRKWFMLYECIALESFELWFQLYDFTFL